MLLLLFSIRELACLIMQFNRRFSRLSLDEQETAAYFAVIYPIKDI